MNRRLIIPLLIGATLLTYSRAFFLDFTSWDDADTIAANPRITSPSFENVLHYWRHAELGLYIPVTYTWWSMLATFARTETADGEIVLRAAVFHGGNLLLHGIAVLLVFGIVRRLVDNDTAAAVGALLFALHPVQVEAVAWASGAKDLLGAVLGFATVDQILRFVEMRRSGAAKRSGYHYVGALVLFALAVLAKPSGVVAPVIAAVLVWFRLSESPRAMLRWILPLLVLAGACALWSRIAQPQYEPTETPLWTRPLIAADAIALYLWKLVWPMDLGIVYGRTPRMVLDSGQAYLTWLVPVAMGTVIFLLRRRVPWLAAGAVVFVVGLLPVLGFARFMFQIHSTVADHYLYLPMLGVAIVVAGVIALQPRGIVVGVCAAALLLLAVMSNRQLRHWTDSEALFTQALRVNPHATLPRALLAQHYVNTTRLDDAIEQFRIIVEQSPNSRLAHANLAYAYMLAGRTDAAIEHGTLALRLAGPRDNTAWEHYVLARAYLLAGQYDRAVHHFQQRLTHHPHEAAARDLEEAIRLRHESDELNGR